MLALLHYGEIFQRRLFPSCVGQGQGSMEMVVNKSECSWNCVLPAGCGKSMEEHLFFSPLPSSF